MIYIYTDSYGKELHWCYASEWSIENDAYFLGRAESATEVAQVLSGITDLFGLGGFELSYAREFYNACCIALDEESFKWHE